MVGIVSYCLSVYAIFEHIHTCARALARRDHTKGDVLSYIQRKEKVMAFFQSIQCQFQT